MGHKWGELTGDSNGTVVEADTCANCGADWTLDRNTVCTR